MEATLDKFKELKPIPSFDLPEGWKIAKPEIDNIGTYAYREELNYRNGNYNIKAISIFDKYIIIPFYYFDGKFTNRSPVFPFLHSKFQEFIGTDSDIEYSSKSISAEQFNAKLIKIMKDVNNGKYDKRMEKQNAEYYEGVALGRYAKGGIINSVWSWLNEPTSLKDFFK